ACNTLERNGWLASGAWIYLECETGETLEGVPENWHIHRAKQTGGVAYRLCRRMI
ncbi:MAG: 16S rRNA (guanine(966)-N(2))-methyltransferase RsmD, partial [Methylococcaceae bacterium]|nr:16S rRNA (guanine(966)-N(2))-methyltransferase RsmD [Methylococcaceae bacterium]